MMPKKNWKNLSPHWNNIIWIRLKCVIIIHNIIFFVRSISIGLCPLIGSSVRPSFLRSVTHCFNSKQHELHASASLIDLVSYWRCAKMCWAKQSCGGNNFGQITTGRPIQWGQQEERSYNTISVVKRSKSPSFGGFSTLQPMSRSWEKIGQITTVQVRSEVRSGQVGLCHNSGLKLSIDH